MYKHLLLLLIGLIMVSCGDQVTYVSFSEPQPAGKKALSAFPERLKGKYISNDETTTLFIYDHFAVKIKDYEIGAKISDLDSSYRLSGDTLIDNNSGERQPVIIRGDSILVHIHGADTINNITQGDVLKKFKGYYFLNQGSPEYGWVVTRMALTKGKLTTAYIHDSTALAKLDELAEKPADTITQRYTISKKRFKMLLKADGFSDIDTFIKIR